MQPVPAPAIIDGVEWTVRDSGDARKAFVDFDSKTMVVPMNGTPMGDMIRAHETAHVAITPRDLGELKRLAKLFPNRTLQAVEDCRVYCSLRLAGIDTSVGHWQPRDIANIAALGNSPKENEEKTRALVATMGTGDYAKLAAKLPEKNVEVAERLYAEYFAEDMSKGKLPSWDASVAMAKALHEEYNVKFDPETGEGEGGGKGGEGEGEDSTASKGSVKVKEIARPFVPGDIGDERPTPRLTEEYVTDSELRDMSELGVRGYKDGSSPISNENVSYETPPLKVIHKGRSGFGNRRVCSDTGSIPRRLGRYAVDSAVFSKTVKKGFGTVLVDVSGSMNLTARDIDKIIDVLPNTTIAIYSGDGARGHVTVVAKEGKRIAEIPTVPPGNVVDLQALEWLARQRGPRAWICDGVVTGRGDRHLAIPYALKIVRIAKIGKIRRYRTVSALIQGLQERKTTAY